MVLLKHAAADAVPLRAQVQHGSPAAGELHREGLRGLLGDVPQHVSEPGRPRQCHQPAPGWRCRGQAPGWAGVAPHDRTARQCWCVPSHLGLPRCVRGTAYSGPAHRLVRNDLLILFLHMHRGDTMLGWKATRAFLRPSRSPQYWLVGRQVKCHPAAASHAVEGEVVDLGTSARSRHNVLACRSGAPAAEQPRFKGMTLWPVGNLLWPTSGPLITVTCMSIRGNTWTDALHAARFSCLTLSLYHLGVGWFLYPFVLFLWPIACVYA